MIHTQERVRFTDAEMATVRDTDLPDLLVSLGYQVKRIGNYYTTQEMDSIRIKNRRTWFRYSEGIGGDAISFLQRFCNKSFPEAVEYLLAWHGRARDSPPASIPRQTKEKEAKVPFTLPPVSPDHRRVFAYLRKRGIASQVIRGFLEAGLLWSSSQTNRVTRVWNPLVESILRYGAWSAHFQSSQSARETWSPTAHWRPPGSVSDSPGSAGKWSCFLWWILWP